MDQRNLSDATNEQRTSVPEGHQKIAFEAEGGQFEPAKSRRIRKMRRVKRPPKLDLNPEKILCIPGVTKLVFSDSTQKSLKCVVGEDVTAEYPWKRIPKEDLTDNLELYEAESDIYPIKDGILAYPCQEFLTGYMPCENRDFEEFYICVSQIAEEAVTQIINNILAQREERLNNSILKKVGSWKPQGSAKEVEQQILKNNRPLLEMEFETPYPIRDTKSRFKLKFAEHAQDGYIELLSKRIIFSNLLRKKIDVSVQVTPSVVCNVAQTILRYPKNIAIQYEYNYNPIEELGKEFHNNVKSFIDDRMDKIDDSIYVNSYINFYKNDYLGLVKDIRTTYGGAESFIKECFSLYDQTLRKGKVIDGLSWHPMWSGILAISYSNDAPNLYKQHRPNDDEVLTALYDENSVQLWSFTDTLTAKLFLEAPRQVTALSFCPTDENILVGGCVNGQVFIWDIKDRLKKVEDEEILKPEQQRYRTRMQSLMTWMKNTYDPKIVRTTVVSDIEYSHNSAVTAIKWLSPYREISKSGKVLNIPDDVERTSCQFVTASRDGTVLMWDLLARPIAREGGYKPRKKLRRLKRRPSALATDVSPLKELNRMLRPSFKVNVLAPNTNRHLPLAALSIRTTSITYEEINPIPNRKYNVTDRVYHKAVFTRAVHPLINQFTAGTVEGDFFVASWEGFEFNAGEVVNKENCKMINFGKVHDGPILSLSRSTLAHDIILSVGGKVFAIWQTNFIGKPVLWRRCKHRYTGGTWNVNWPSIFRLLRDDGCMEIWQLKMRSDRYQHLSFVSGGSLTGTYAHPLSKDQKVLGIADYTSTLRIFANTSTLAREIDDGKTCKIIEREVDRKTKFFKWQDDWKRKNTALMALRKERELTRRKQREEEENRSNPMPQIQIDTRVAEEILKPEVESFAKMAQEQWKLKERKRMNASLLQKKMLDVNLLEKQQMPLKKIAGDQQMLQNKMIQRKNNAQKLFSEAVTTLFPDAVERKLSPAHDPYGGGDCINVKMGHYNNYVEVVRNCVKFVEECKYIYNFNWLILRKAGKETRRRLDGYYTRDNHRSRLVREKEEADRIYQPSSNRREAPRPKQSLESIDLSNIQDEDQVEND